MIRISYTITPAITENLAAIDRLRTALLTLPIRPSMERMLRWHALVDHLRDTKILAPFAISEARVMLVLTHPMKHPSRSDRQIIQSKHALDWIGEQWTANPSPITTDTIVELAVRLLPLSRTAAAVEQERPMLQHLLGYLASSKDHPILMAGIVQGAFAASSLGALGDGALYRLTTALILAKYGYDCRGMVALDPAWGSSPDRYAHALQSVQTLGQMTAWLEYYSGAALTAYTDVFEAMSHSPTRQDMGKTMSFGTLSDRELRVLSRLEAPTSKITNRDVQGMFRLSQVTISRMLSALTAKGLLAAHRRGRSTYYTKI